MEARLMKADFTEKAALGVAHDNITALRLRGDKLEKLVDKQRQIILDQDTKVEAATRQLRASEQTVKMLAGRVRELEAALEEKENA